MSEVRWWKKPIVWVGAGLAFVGAVLAWLFTAGGRGRVTLKRPDGLDGAPPAPEFPDVPVPERTVLDDDAGEDYAQDKEKPGSIAEAIEAVNDRYD